MMFSSCVNLTTAITSLADKLFSKLAIATSAKGVVSVSLVLQRRSLGVPGAFFARAHTRRETI